MLERTELIKLLLLLLVMGVELLLHAAEHEGVCIVCSREYHVETAHITLYCCHLVASENYVPKVQINLIYEG